MIQAAKCGDPGATDRFSFSGTINESGQISGEGLVQVGEEFPEQGICIRIGKLFGAKIRLIRSKFVDGFASSTTFVEFDDEVLQRAEILVANGAARGLFRVEADSWWSLGTILNGVVGGTCVIIHQKYVSWSTSSNFELLSVSASSCILSLLTNLYNQPTLG